MSSEQDVTDSPPALRFPAPGFLRFGWMVLLQPIRFNALYQHWGFGDRVPLGALLKGIRAGNPIAHTLLRHWALWSLITMPTIAVFLPILLAWLNESPTNLYWRGVMAGIASGLITALAVSWYDMRIGVRCGGMFGIVTAVVLAFAPLRGTIGDVLALTVGLAVISFATFLIGIVWMLRDKTVPLRRQMPQIQKLCSEAVFTALLATTGILLASMSLCIALLLAGGVPKLSYLGTLAGILYLNVSILAVGMVFHIIIPLYLIITITGDTDRAMSVFLLVGTAWLFLRSSPRLGVFLEGVATADESLGKALIHEAQSGYDRAPSEATCTLTKLQCRELTKAARARTFHRVVDFDLPFFPAFQELSQDSPLRTFKTIAQDLAISAHNQRRRREAIERARKAMQSLYDSIKSKDDTEAKAFTETASVWLEAIERERQTLADEVAMLPDVPAVFVAGPPLTPDEQDKRALFKGRNDLVQLIEHDLVPGKRGLIVLHGQRRMGKTSLKNWLPLLLGTGTVVVDLDFQEASGSRYRGTLHRWIVEEVARKIPHATMPPDTEPWLDALHWLKDIDKTLDAHTLLVVIDEIERVEDGIRAGWCTTDVLDFLRAAGDSLQYIRFLVLTAYPLYRLGDHWIDRLVSATSRTITYLDEPEARELVTKPVPDFPDIYPEGGLDRILNETGRHPYLIQKVCDELCAILNKRGAHKATDSDLIEAFDKVVNEADLFDELWRQRTEPEREMLRALAEADPASRLEPVARSLVREGYLTLDGDRLDFAVPLFRAWILLTQSIAWE